MWCVVRCVCGVMRCVCGVMRCVWCVVRCVVHCNTTKNLRHRGAVRIC